MSDILDDAVLVLDYASARGLLPADSALPAAVGKAQATLGVMTPELQQELVLATNAAAKAMLPMTIDRLHDRQQAEKLTGWPKYRYLARRGLVNFFTPAAIYVLCAFLIVVIIAWTMQFNRLAALTAELKATESEDAVSLLDDAKSAQDELEALRKARATPATRPGAPAAAAADTEIKRAEITQKEAALQAKLKKLRELDSKVGIDRRAISQTVDTTNGEPRLWRIVLWTYGLTSLDPNEARDESKTVMEALPPKPATPAPGAAGTQTPPPPPDPECRNSPPTSQVCGAFAFGRGHGLAIASPKDLQTAYEARRQAEVLTVLLGTAILPVMYGLLGAGVFLLRGFLGESEATMGVIRPNFAKASLRFGLGGIAGLAIGWFWVPKTGDTTFQTTPFALAFLAGFSIELLFSLLDRILNAVNPRTPAPGK